MPKIVSDNGIELYFEDYDILKSGDIFVHGVAKNPTSDSRAIPLTGSKIPMPTISAPKHEPSTPVIRIARPPVSEPRLGLMCPHCHQSRAVLFSNDVVVVAKLNNPKEFIMSQRIIWDDITTYDLKIKKEVIKFLCESDEYIMGCLERTTVDLLALVQDYDDSSIATCPICLYSSLIQEWVNEFASPNTNYYNICKICGSEMSIADGKGRSTKKSPLWKCDNKVCNYSYEG